MTLHIFCLGEYFGISFKHFFPFSIVPFPSIKKAYFYSFDTIFHKRISLLLILSPLEATILFRWKKEKVKSIIFGEMIARRINEGGGGCFRVALLRKVLSEAGEGQEKLKGGTCAYAGGVCSAATSLNLLCIVEGCLVYTRLHMCPVYLCVNHLLQVLGTHGNNAFRVYTERRKIW